MPVKGSKMTDEARRKMALTKRGVWHDVTCMCGCGTVFSVPDSRVKRGTLLFVDQGHVRTYLSGPNHPNFRGGPAHYGIGWDKIATAVRERDQICRHCGKTPEANGRALAVHHIMPVRVSQDNSMENLIALCDSCHAHERISDHIVYAVSPPTLYTPTCDVCGATFSTHTAQLRVCSDVCRKKRQGCYSATYWKRAAEQNSTSHQRKRARQKEASKRNQAKAIARNTIIQQAETQRLRAIVAQFLDHCCACSPLVETALPDLSAAFDGWCERSGHKTMSRYGLAVRLSHLGFKTVRRRVRGQKLMINFVAGVGLR